MGVGAKPNPRFEAFDPETAAAMGLAFDTAWQVLLVTGSELVSSFRAEETREALALRIITLTKLGERDVFRLHDDAIAHVRRLANTQRNPSGAAQHHGASAEAGRRVG
jgi:hypothetical protein